jgi:hypothetical protein
MFHTIHWTVYCPYLYFNGTQHVNIFRHSLNAVTSCWKVAILYMRKRCIVFKRGYTDPQYFRLMKGASFSYRVVSEKLAVFLLGFLSSLKRIGYLDYNLQIVYRNFLPHLSGFNICHQWSPYTSLNIVRCNNHVKYDDEFNVFFWFKKIMSSLQDITCDVLPKKEKRK